MVGPEEEIQILSLAALTGFRGRGISRHSAVEMVLTDFGPTKRHRLTKEAGLDSLYIACLDAVIAFTAHTETDL